MAGAKLAVQTLPMMPVQQRSFEVQKQIATAWAEFAFFAEPPARPSLNGGGADQSQFHAPAGSASTGGAGTNLDPIPSTAPPHGDQDIPFAPTSLDSDL